MEEIGQADIRPSCDITVCDSTFLFLRSAL